MSYFESLLQTRRKTECPLPLWKLKVTDEEFDELRNLLEKRTHILSTNPFKGMSKECTLFFAEYWRRHYAGGAHKKQMVYDALEATPNGELSKMFYEAACEGAKLLKIEKYDGGRTDPLDDILYQGGLPMKLVTENKPNSVWDKFARGLIYRKYDFDELSIGKVASKSNSLKEFCEQLTDGIEAGQHLKMPFHCNNEKDKWFVYLKELATQEKKRRQHLQPFSMDWEFRVDSVEKKISTYYVITGLQRLPDAFLQEHRLYNVNFFSVQVRKNGQSVDTFDYANFFCRYPVISRHSYNDGDYISLYLHNHKDAYLGDCLDMSVPLLLLRNNDGKYTRGNRLGLQESIILIPDGWNVETAIDFPIAEYSWGTTRLKGIDIPADYQENIVVTSDDGSITFGQDTTLYWTGMLSHPLYIPNVIESVYDASKCNYRLCYFTEDGVKSRHCNVQYRNKWQNEWINTPSYGEIFVRAICDDGNYVTPLKFINIGDGLCICPTKEDKDSCQIKVTWAHGSVSTTEGEKKANDTWEVRKEDCHDPRKIRFTLTPFGNGKNQFDISIKAPFKDFSIKNIYGDDVENDSWIPYSEIDKYQYHLVGQEIKEYTYGDTKRALSWRDNQLYIFENGKKLKSIPYEGSLLTLFDNREVLRSSLERTSQNMLDAEVKVQFSLAGGKKLTFGIKDSPLRLAQIAGGRVVITGNNRKPVKYTGVLKLLRLDKPKSPSCEMNYDEASGCYILPEEIRPWGNTLAIGRTRGLVCPALVNINVDMDREYRTTIRKETIDAIKNSLQNSVLGDDTWTRIIDWFNQAQQEDIPASSILELSCTAEDYKALLCLAFQLYATCRNDAEIDELKEKLKTFSHDLAFQWYWMKPHLNGTFNLLYRSFFPKDPMADPIKDIYINWAMKKEESRMKYISALSDGYSYDEYIGECFIELINKFTAWMKELCIDSMIEAYEYDTQKLIRDSASDIIKNDNYNKLYKIEINAEVYVDANKDIPEDEANTFFNDFAKPGMIDNELWLYKRVNAVVAHLNKKIDLFSKDAKIRRSIIYCCKSCNSHFVKYLNNELAR